MPRPPVQAPKDGHTLAENTGTQPRTEHRVFNNTEVLTEGWFPALPSRQLRRGRARSVVIFRQRLALYRGADGRVRALDAFCPHMGADLANGAVVGDELQCYFHRWRFDERGELSGLPCAGKRPKNARVRAWPVEEKYGWIWVYSAAEAPYPVPSPPGLEGETLEALHLMAPLLYAHHHVMMAGGIDLQHFATVHDLDVAFEFEVSESAPNVFEWTLEGELPRQRLRDRVYRWLLGPRVGYHARFAGGSIVSLCYGPNQRWFGRGPKIPPLYILWGCLPQTDGVSRVHVFVVSRKRRGLLGWLTTRLLYALTVVLLVVLRDDDVKAFPNMRFDAKNLVEADRSVARFIQLTDKLPTSEWSGRPSRAALEVLP